MCVYMESIFFSGQYLSVFFTSIPASSTTSRRDTGIRSPPLTILWWASVTESTSLRLCRSTSSSTPPTMSLHRFFSTTSLWVGSAAEGATQMLAVENRNQVFFFSSIGMTYCISTSSVPLKYFELFNYITSKSVFIMYVPLLRFKHCKHVIRPNVYSVGIEADIHNIFDCAWLTIYSVYMLIE